jgi:23S rRNA (uracil1939-C5)-methyltransferase
MDVPNAWKGSIESLSQEGLGIGTMITKVDGKDVRRPIFIPFTVPGDEVEADITEQKRKYTFGMLSKITTPSPLRAEPECPHFTVCGGCNLQHVAYDEQLLQKGAQISFLLSRKGVKLPHDVKVLPAKQRRNYRRRAKVAMQFTGGRLNAGFRKFHAHDIIPVSKCLIVAPEIEAFISLLNRSESRVGMTGSFTQEAVVVVGDNRKAGILVPLDDTPQQQRKAVRDFFEDLYSRNRKLIGNLFFEENRVTRTSGQVQEHITYKAAGLTFSFLPETFIQSNIATNETLIATAIGFLSNDGDIKKETVLDMYAGLGNISLPAAKVGKHVVAVEGHEASVLLGRINAYQNGIENTTFIHRSAEKYIYEYIKNRRAGTVTEEYPVADRIVIDPPRTGCTPEVLRGLLMTGIKRIVYISCNPVTLAGDLAKLGESYDIKDIIAIDMFPDISHVETIVRLDLRK